MKLRLQKFGFKSSAVSKQINLTIQLRRLSKAFDKRREFEKAKDNDMQRAERALALIQKLYKIEAEARETNPSPEERRTLRLNRSLPLLNLLGKWTTEEVKSTLPKSQIAKSMKYGIERWDALSAYLYDGTLEIDNKLGEKSLSGR